jgi:hypothetical protein
MSETYYLISPSLKQTTNLPGELSFSIPAEHVSSSLINRLSSRLSVYRDDALIWIGRPIESSVDIYGTTKWICEGCLAYLCDTIQRPFEFQGSPTDLFTNIINSHNAQVNQNQMLQVGVVTVTDPNDYINRSSVEYLSSWDVLKTRLLDSLGGYLFVTYPNGQPTLNWYAVPPDTSTQIIEFGQNLQDYARTVYGSETYTACIPLGAKDEATGERLTISSVNGGNDFITSPLADSLGYIYAPSADVTWEDVTVPANLLTKAQNWLTNYGTKYKEKVNLKAIDLHNTDANIESFQFLDTVLVRSTPNGLSASYILTQITIPLNDPSSTTITLGGEQLTLVSQLAKAQGNVQERVGTIEADYVTTGQAAAISNREIENSTWIQQEADRIVATALQEFVETGDFATLQQTVQSQFSILANEISINFTTLSSQITQQGTNIQQTLDQYAAWFRFLSYGLVIGNSGSPIQMVLKNDVLYFCTDPDNVTTANAIAYFSAGQLYVNFINVQNLTVGMTGRWLDVRIVGSGDNVCALFSGRLS